MPKLPTTLGERATPTPQRRVYAVDNTQMAEAQMRIGRATEASGKELMGAALEMEKKQEKDALLDAVRRDNEAQQLSNTLLYGDGTEDNPGLYSTKGANALNSQAVFSEKWKEIKNKSLEGVTNPVARASLEKSLMGMETGTLGNIQRFVQEERKGYTVDLLEGRQKLANERVAHEYNNPDTLTASLQEVDSAAVNVAKIKGWKEGDEAFKSYVKEQKSGVYATQLKSMFGTGETDKLVAGVKLFDEYKKSGAIDFKTIEALEGEVESARPKVEAVTAFQKLPSVQAGDPIGFVMQDLEGGDKYVPDGGGMSKFGINSVANPDIDVANLDEKGARDAYKTRYWDANKIDELPANMQLVAFDTAVNHGSAFKDKVLKAIKGGATVDDVMVMRLNEYERLAESNPAKYGKDLPGWKNRLKKLYDRQANTDVSQQFIDPTLAAAAMSGLRPEAQKEFSSLVENNNTRLLATKAAERKAVLDQSMAVITSGGVSAMPVELKARAREAGVLDGLESYTGATEPETASFLYSLDPATLAKTDIDDPSIRLKLSPSDYQRWTAKKNSLATSANLVAETTRKKLVDEAFQKRNINPNTSSKLPWAQTARMQGIRLNEMLDLEVDAFTSQNNGRYPNQAEMTKMVDGLFIKGNYDNSGMFGVGDEEHVFDIDVENIPKKERALIEQALSQTGKAVTNSAIIRTYIEKQNGR